MTGMLLRSLQSLIVQKKNASLDESITVYACVYIRDDISLKPPGFSSWTLLTRTAGILEALVSTLKLLWDCICKLLWDCRNDADALKHLYNVSLKNILDLLSFKLVPQIASSWLHTLWCHVPP